jgi:hypothetical protein
VSRHAYVRVHVHPKRFPAAYSVDWKVRPLYANSLYTSGLCYVSLLAVMSSSLCAARSASCTRMRIMWS